jgi:eukaryotic-like serine/threonine-protein kinase
MEQDADPQTRVGDRYVLLNELGRGGMASVHRAYDEVLDRTVAVKLLHPHLAHDPAFLERFRREARSAAALSHPNVVGVHDWGEGENGAYLVLQLIEGLSLREVLRNRGRLEPAEALAVLGPAAAGLAAAHASGLVHRDVKPENLLIGRDGTVRVTDFGLARAAASATSTFGADVLVGSPHYLSPEAVKGLRLDARADVYALGIVLFECLTGSPPHEGETPFLTAMTHASTPVPVPSEFRPELSEDIDDVVLLATAIDREERVPDAAAFGRVLAAAVPIAAAAAPLPAARDLIDDDPIDAALGGDDRVGAGHVDDDTEEDGRGDDDRGAPQGDTRVVSPVGDDAGSAAAGHTRRLTPNGSSETGADDRHDDEDDATDADDPAATAIVRDTTGRDPASRNRQRQGRRGRRGSSPAAAHAAAVKPRKRRGWIVLVFVLLLVAGSAVGGYLVWDRVLAPVTPVPGVLGAEQPVAAEQLVDAGFEVAIDDDRPHDLSTPEGHVLAQRPVETARLGSTVTLVVSAGPAQVEVAELGGSDREDAEAQLSSDGLEPVVVEEYDEAVPSGEVIATSPPGGAVVDEASEVTVTVSLGPAPIEVPEITGSSEADARATVEELGLELTVTDRRTDAEAPAGSILSQAPAPGMTLRRGEEVSVVLSDGPEQVTVPGVRGQPVDEAVAQLEALGFEVEVERRGGFGAFLNPDTVYDQDPPPDSVRDAGDRVLLYAYED